ncbi:hypothetical protein GOODEAATRI_007153 [Goodea atripinnis]|uniref:Uncharacterized protein n=1 Tax=Goodea atripinnis TaxID=208336 RepID=A0ABV0MFR0_9TELE
MILPPPVQCYFPTKMLMFSLICPQQLAPHVCCVNVERFKGCEYLCSHHVKRYFMSTVQLWTLVAYLFVLTDNFGIVVALICYCSTPNSIKEAKRETVEPLQNMNSQKKEGYIHLHHCIQVHQKEAE